eukprot:TRINITY_DN1161_c1_g1_i1.p1 TRINITY_DN1161_c1_g1~~TRINITY_DN1161_c1_g1_i1.p1  ORF type:complete len:883 (+),score=211.14 TRINITY_DN1161_c1_g1_i1:105-2651(+)
MEPDSLPTPAPRFGARPRQGPAGLHLLSGRRARFSGDSGGSGAGAAAAPAQRPRSSAPPDSPGPAAAGTAAARPAAAPAAGRPAGQPGGVSAAAAAAAAADAARLRDEIMDEDQDTTDSSEGIGPTDDDDDDDFDALADALPEPQLVSSGAAAAAGAGMDVDGSAEPAEGLPRDSTMPMGWPAGAPWPPRPPPPTPQQPQQQMAVLSGAPHSATPVPFWGTDPTPPHAAWLHQFGPGVAPPRLSGSQGMPPSPSPPPAGLPAFAAEPEPRSEWVGFVLRPSPGGPPEDRDMPLAWSVPAVFVPGTAKLLTVGGCKLFNGGAVTAPGADGAEGPIAERSPAGQCTVHDLAPCGGDRRGRATALTLAALLQHSWPRAADSHLRFQAMASVRGQLRRPVLRALQQSFARRLDLEPTVAEGTVSAAAARRIALRHAADTVALIAALWGTIEGDLDAEQEARERAAAGHPAPQLVIERWEQAERRRQLGAWLAAAPAVGAAGRSPAEIALAHGRIADAVSARPGPLSGAFAACVAFAELDGPDGRELLRAKVNEGTEGTPGDAFSELCRGCAFVRGSRHWAPGQVQWRVELQQHLLRATRSATFAPVEPNVRVDVADFVHRDDCSMPPPQWEALQCAAAGQADSLLARDLKERCRNGRDICGALLRLWSHGAGALKTADYDALCGRGSWSYAEEHTLPWAVAVMLAEAELLTELPVTMLTRRHAAQLEAEGLWQWAVVLALTHKDTALRKSEVLRLLRLHATEPPPGGLPEDLAQSDADRARGEVRLRLPPPAEGSAEHTVNLPQAWLEAAIQWRRPVPLPAPRGRSPRLGGLLRRPLAEERAQLLAPIRPVS